MNIQIIRSVPRCRKAWERQMLQKFVSPWGLLSARPNCSHAPFPSSPLLAPSVKRPMCRALAGSEDAGNHPDLFPFPFSVPKSGACSYSQFLFLSFQSLFLLLTVMDRKHFKNNQEVQTCFHIVLMIIKTLYHTIGINAAYRGRHNTADVSNFCVILEYSFTFSLAQSIHVSLWYIVIQKQKQGNTKDGNILPSLQF